MQGRPFRLSKSQYVAGQQCVRMLWWRIHEPKAPELVPGEALQAVFDQGRPVGELAREHVPGGVLIGAPEMEIPARLEATRRAMEAGAEVLYEAAFEHDGVVAVADILQRSRKAWTLIEVKSTTSVKDQHIPDLAVQAWVLRGGGIEVRRTELMHLNRECRYPDLSNLFVRENLTDRVESTLAVVADRIAAFRAALAGPLPLVAIGSHCSSPYECPFWDRCWAGVPEHSLWSLYKLNGTKREALEKQGISTIAQIPADAPLTEIQARQRRAVAGNALIVEAGLAGALKAVEYPIAYLDFESINPAIPVWPGMRPYDQAPVQVSVHVEERDGTVRHFEWLADGPEDARPEMARRTIEFTSGAGSIVVYNASFENARLAELEEVSPKLAPELARIRERLWDLLPVVREHVYHPGFGGGFGLKAVLPVLVEGAGYNDLEVTEGGSASRLLMGLLFQAHEMSALEREDLRRDLLAYCERDTNAMVLLLRRLRQIAR